MTSPLLELRQLSYEREERILFCHLDLQCRAGDLVQIVGPNGSGKTSLLHCVAGLNRNYQGDILWCGKSVAGLSWDYRQDLVFLGHLPGIKKALTPMENLRWYAGFSHGGSEGEIRRGLEALGLDAYEDTPCYQLSAGQQRRVGLVRLHLNRARLWVLDEPFTAIDKAGVEDLQALLENHLARGGIALLTSHQDLALSGVSKLYLPDYFPQADKAAAIPAEWE